VIRNPDPDNPHHYYARGRGPYLRVPGTVFYDEVWMSAAMAAERRLFEDLDEKWKGSPKKKSPALYSSFVRTHRLQQHEQIVVDRIRVVLTDEHGWQLPEDVYRWFSYNVELTLEVNRIELVQSLLGFLDGEDGYELPMAHRLGGRPDYRSPRDVIDCDSEIQGVLRVLRDPGRVADAIIRVEAIGSWLVETRRDSRDGPYVIRRDP
jgi:hypothetical protein